MDGVVDLIALALEGTRRKQKKINGTTLPQKLSGRKANQRGGIPVQINKLLVVVWFNYYYYYYYCSCTFRVFSWV